MSRSTFRAVLLTLATSSHFLTSILCISTLFTAMHAQSVPGVAKAATLDVASIKVSPENVGGYISIQPGGRIVMTNVRVRDFVNMVYSTDPPLLTQQIEGLPLWASEVRYNIEAKFSSDGVDSTFDPKRGTGSYVRAVLEARFAFKAHLERRELPVYFLTVTDANKLKASTIECKADNPQACWDIYQPGRFDGPATEVSELTLYLGNAAGRPVLDRTGLTGRFDVHLQWNPDPLDATDTRPSIFGALGESGLKLDASRAPSDVLVIDHIEKPHEN